MTERELDASKKAKPVKNNTKASNELNATISINAQTQSLILMGDGKWVQEAVLYKLECLPWVTMLQEPINGCFF